VKVHLIFIRAVLFVFLTSQAFAVNLHQEWSCGPLIDRAGKGISGASRFTLLCLLVSQSVGKFSEKSCLLTQTTGKYPSLLTQSVMFPLLEGVSVYPDLYDGQYRVHFDQFKDPFFYRATVFLGDSQVSCVFDRTPT
jgi:hypothetical protein